MGTKEPNKVPWGFIIIVNLLVSGFVIIGTRTVTYDQELPIPKALDVRWTLPDNNVSSWLPGRSLPPELQDCEQDDPRLISEIHDHWLLHPTNQQLNLKGPDTIHFSQHGQSSFMDAFLHNKTRGIYVECGAFDGEELSNTLYFERLRYWDGLLIEADPTLFQSAVSKHRHAYMVNTCVSTSRQTERMNYTIAGCKGGITGVKEQTSNLTTSRRTLKFSLIQCLPLQSIMAALNFPRIDFFSLDIEGAELLVLQTLDFDRVNIDTFLVEAGHRFERKEEITKFLETKGYHSVDVSDFDPIDILMTKLDNLY